MRLADRAEPGFGGARSGLAESGDVHDDDRRVVARQGLVRHTPLVERPRLEVFEHDVAACCDAPHERASPLVAQIDGRAALVARDRRPPQALDATILFGNPHAVAAHDVAGRGWFDLDDVGAEVAEQLACERSGDERAQLEHAHTGQRGVAHERQGNLRPSRRFRWTSRRAPAPTS
jgi:hypothetical protein